MSDAGDFRARDWSVHPPYRHEGYKSTALRSPSKPLVPLDWAGPRDPAGYLGVADRLIDQILAALPPAEGDS